MDKDQIHTISFGPKFCQAQFDFVLKENITIQSENGDLTTSHWKRSFEVNEVIFDLTITEWVATEQIAYLFAWIRNLKSAGKKILVRLPYRAGLSKKYSGVQLKALGSLYKNTDGTLFEDNERKVKRRERSNAFLMIAYGMKDRLGLIDENFENASSSYGVSNNDMDMIRRSSNQIVPFSVFELPILNLDEKLDLHFYDVINNHYNSSYITSNVFDVKQNEITKLIQKGCYAPFETRIISNVITQELYTNSLQHSFEDVSHTKLLKEAYLTSFLSDQWKEEDTGSKFFTDSFTGEKHPEGVSFYKDKKDVCRRISEQLKTKQAIHADWDRNKELYKQFGFRLANISNFNEDFKNSPNLEYTFLDFGKGIIQSLKDQYYRFISINPKFAETDSESNQIALEHDKIIEYAFHLDSSKSPLEKNIDNYNMVPRGLYFVIDMVRRFKGMLTVRSGFGKVVFDFSDKVVIEHEFSEDDNSHQITTKLKSIYKLSESIVPRDRSNSVYFPGTIFSIVLPPEVRTSSKESANVRMSIPGVRSESEMLSHYAFSLKEGEFAYDHPKTAFYPEEFSYVSILFIYNEIIEKISGNLIDFDVKSIYNLLFTKINSLLDSEANKNQILFLDFAGFKSGNPSYLKILYFLINTPKVNEQNKIIIVNLPQDEKNILEEIKVNLFGKEEDDEKLKAPFLFKPIPCIDFNILFSETKDVVKWIGIRDKEDETLLTELLLGKLRKGKDNVLLSDLKRSAGVEGGLFVKNQERLFTTLPAYENLKTHFFESQQPVVVNFLSQNIKNGITPEEQSMVFLSSNGGFQFSYISLYEILNDKHVARFFAKSLLDKYCLEISKRVLEGERPEQYKFDKIVTVTVSSQLIGIAMRELIEKDPAYSFFRKGATDIYTRLNSPELILLSSYYSFDKEKPFSQIAEGDRVLLLNDVISTGKLLDSILQRLNDDRKAITTAVFSIVDTRIKEKDLVNKPYKELLSTYFEEAERNFFTLAGYEQGIVIRKFEGPYKGSAVIARVNPLLNTIVTMDSMHSEEERVLFETSDFINDDKIDSIYLKIGHYHQNLSHIGYLTDVRRLFSSDKGKKILGDIHKFISHSVFSISEANYISRIEDQLYKVRASHKMEVILDSFDNVMSTLQALKKMISENEKKEYFRPDFIFYPIFSGIEVMGQTALAEIFGTHPDNIIGLQRYSTPKGWRFPFPAKRYNKMTKNKVVLILDSGSLSGDSLVQLIDSVSFLDVKEIYMLSVVTRIDDFNREFYSRLRALKVKKLRGDDQEGGVRDKNNESIIPLQILFGIKLNIPVYPKASCPFCLEKTILTNYGLSSHAYVPNSDIREFLKKRIDELGIQDVGKQLSNAAYLPKKNGHVNTKELFIMRDILGKVDNYRFYSQNTSLFEELTDEITDASTEWFRNKAIQKRIELMLGCIVHEESLFGMIDNLLHGTSSQLQTYLRLVLDGSLPVENLFFEWSNTALLRLVHIVLDKGCFSLDTFEKILIFDEDEAKAFPQFMIWDALFNKASTTERKTLAERLVLDIEQARQDKRRFPKSTEVIKILRDSYNLENIVENTFLTVPFYNLHKFFIKAEYRGRHFALTEELNELVIEAAKISVSLSVISQKLSYINKYLQDVYGNITVITFDDHFREYCSEMDVVLGERPGGMLHYIKRFIQYEKPENLFSVEAFNKIQSDLLGDANKIVNEVLLDKPGLRNFFQLCRGYICNYAEVLTDVFKDDSQLIFRGNTEIPAVHRYMSCHRDIFRIMIKEIVKNAKERYKKDVQLSCRVAIIKDEEVEFEFNQNKPFISSDRQGGLTNQVQYYCGRFKGTFFSNSEDSALSGTDFIIRMKLRIHKYQ